MRQLDILEQEVYSANRFVWIHTQNETDLGFHDEAVARGAWIEYDHVSRAPDNEVRDLIVRALEAGQWGNLLVSHDVGWFDPAKPGGGIPRSFTHLTDVMLPLLKAHGVRAEELRQLTSDNPFSAYARFAPPRTL